MAAQLKIGLAALTTGVGAWSFYVYSERQKLPQGRRRRFSLGSTDDYMSEALKSGDVVVMNRDWKLYQPLGALQCLATKYFSGTPFDHAGVIVLLQGEPYVLEQTFTSVKLRLFEERVMCSRATQVAIRPLHDPVRSSSFLCGPPRAPRHRLGRAVAQLSARAERSLVQIAQAREGDASDWSPVAFVSRLLRTRAWIRDIYAAIGLVDVEENARPIMKRLTPGKRSFRFREPTQKWDAALWFRDLPRA